MEADYGLQCGYASVHNDKPTPKYESFYPYVILAGIAYALGVPLFFMGLVRRYADDGKAGDKVVETALSWMYQPLRVGKEWVRAISRLFWSQLINRFF